MNAADDLIKKHGLDEVVVRTDLNRPTGGLKVSRQTVDEAIENIENELRTAPASKKADLESKLDSQRRRAAQLDEILAAREAGNIDYMRVQDVPVDKLPNDRLQAARDNAAQRARSARRPSWKRDALDDLKKYNAELARRKGGDSGKA